MIPQSFKDQVPPVVFIRIALVVSGLWFLAIYPAIQWYYPEKLPSFMRSHGGDFGQYYSGGLVARHGLWSVLYPKPNPEIYGKPPEFKPLLSTPFFKRENLTKGWTFYPSVASPDSSTVAPELLKLDPRLLGDNHYMYPPPLAVLMWPFGYLDAKSALFAWFTLACAAYFGMGFFAARICRGFWERPTYSEGWVVLLPVFPTLLSSNMSTCFSNGNVSPILGFFVAWVAYCWIHNRQLGIGIGMIPLVLFKGIGLSWCPLLLERPIRWKTIGTLAFLTLLLNGIALWLGGVEPYRIFFTDILPKGNIPLGIGLPGILKSLLGINPKPLVGALNLLLLGAVYWGYWRNRHAPMGTQRHAIMIATFAATMAILCLTNASVWPHHYFTNYLQWPFAGWILWEGFQARGAWRKWIFGMCTLSLLFWMDALFLMKDSYLMGWLKNAHLFSERINLARSALSGFVVYGLSLMESSFLLLLAYRRLFFSHDPGSEIENGHLKGRTNEHSPA